MAKVFIDENDVGVSTIKGDDIVLTGDEIVVKVQRINTHDLYKVPVDLENKTITVFAFKEGEGVIKPNGGFITIPSRIQPVDVYFISTSLFKIRLGTHGTFADLEKLRPYYIRLNFNAYIDNPMYFLNLVNLSSPRSEYSVNNIQDLLRVSINQVLNDQGGLICSKELTSLHCNRGNTEVNRDVTSRSYNIIRNNLMGFGLSIKENNEFNFDLQIEEGE